MKQYKRRIAMKKLERTIRIVATIAIVSILVGYGVYHYFYIYQPAVLRGQIHSIGRLELLGVDVVNATNGTSIREINWGTLYPSDNKTLPIRVINIGNTAAFFRMYTDAYNPANASIWISTTWNYTGAKISAKASQIIGVTIHIAPTIKNITNFSFNMTISVSTT